MSETVALAVRSQESVTFLLGFGQAGQRPFEIQRYPIAEINPDRLQSLRDQGECEVAWRRARRDGRLLRRASAGRGRFGGRRFVDLVLKSQATRLQEHVSGLISFPLILVAAFIAAELAGA